MQTILEASSVDTNVDPSFLTSQERDFCVGVAQGQPPKTVATALGMSGASHVRLLKLDRIQNMLAVLKAQVERYTGIVVTRDLLSEMLFEAHATSGTSTEKIAAVRELGKMHGMYAPEKIEVSNQVATKIQHLEGLTDDELVQRAGLGLSLRNEQPIIDVITDVDVTEETPESEVA